MREWLLSDAPFEWLIAMQVSVGVGCVVAIWLSYYFNIYKPLKKLREKK